MVPVGVEGEASDLGKSGVNGRRSTADFVHVAFSNITESAKLKRIRASFGLPGLDSYINGLFPGNLVIVGSRPGGGKTSFCLELIHQALDRNTTPEGGVNETWKGDDILFVAAGERASTVIEKILYARSSIEPRLLRSGRVYEKQFRDFVQQADLLHNGNPGIAILDGLYPRTLDVLSAIQTLGNHARQRRAELSEQCERPPIAIIDSIQHLRPLRDRQNRHQEIAETVREIRCTADSVGVVVVASSPLNRFHRTRENAWPVLSDLRDSGVLEDEADVVLLLDQDPREEDRLKGGSQERSVIVAKNRTGEEGRVPICRSPAGRFFEPKADEEG